MKASELRIGNYLLKSLKSGNGRKINDKIGVQDIVRIYENTGSFNYEPILITEEWLLKLGFEKQYDYWDCKNVYFELAENNDGKFIHSINCHEYSDGEEIEFIHELQNLFFALTKVDLELGLQPS